MMILKAIESQNYYEWKEAKEEYLTQQEVLSEENQDTKSESTNEEDK